MLEVVLARFRANSDIVEAKSSSGKAIAIAWDNSLRDCEENFYNAAYVLCPPGKFVQLGPVTVSVVDGRICRIYIFADVSKLLI